MTQYTPAEIVDLAHGLIDGNTAAADRVYKWRKTPFQDAELPAIAIYCTSTSMGQRGNEPNLLFRRTDTLEVQVHAEAADIGDPTAEAKGIAEECVRRVFASMDVRKDFYPSQAVSINDDLDRSTDRMRVISTLSIDLTQDYQFAEVRTGDAFEELRGTTDIDQTGSAQDVVTQSTMTGGTP